MIIRNFFAGRKFDIEKAIKSLCSPGASMVVYGERGVGKSSFVEMVKQIARGDVELVYRLKLDKLFPNDRVKYRIISLECDGECNTTAKVLQRLITSPNGIKSIIKSKVDKIETTVKDKYALDILKLLSLGIENESKITTIDYKEDSIFETFSNLIQIIQKNVLSPSEGLLIIVDEFDLVQDSEKMASLIKTLSKNNVKFLLSGIAETYEQLIKGHVSITRQLVYGRINILPMKKDEVIEVFDLVESSTNRQIRFEKGFAEHVFSKSNGYPYFVQLFGQLALDSYMTEKGTKHTPVIIHNQHLKNGIRKLGTFEAQMEQEYLSIIKENPLKEFIIKFIAESISKKINDDEIYAYCYRNKIMQPHPKNTVTNLLAYREPQFLIRENETSRYLFFANPLFKTFVNAREPELIRYTDGGYSIPDTRDYIAEPHSKS